MKLLRFFVMLLLLSSAFSAFAQDSLHVRRLGSCVTPGFAWAVAVSGNYAYVADGNDGGLRVVNITNPVAPVEAGFYDTPGGAYGVAVSGNYAYVAHDNLGLRVVNITNPSSPVEVGFSDTPGSARGVAVSGNYAYVADAGSGLRVANITNPVAPFEVGYYDTPGYAYGVAVSGNYAYVADYGSGLRVVSITNPAAPTEVGFYDTPGNAYGVAVSGCRAYVADGSNLGIYDISYFAPCPVPRVPDSLIIQYLPETQDFLLRWAPVLQDTAGLPIEVDYYVVLRGDSTHMDSIGVPVPPDTTVFIDSTAFDAGASFFYQVKAVKN
jgi:hypothetical protein